MRKVGEDWPCYQPQYGLAKEEDLVDISSAYTILRPFQELSHRDATSIQISCDMTKITAALSVLKHKSEIFSFYLLWEWIFHARDYNQTLMTCMRFLTGSLSASVPD